MRVFLSYSRSDRAVVDRFGHDLSHAGIGVWRDVDALRGGEEWRTQIIHAIGQCDVFLLLISPAAMGSDNVRRELTVAEEDHKRIVPVLLAPAAIPDNFRYSLAGVQYTDVSGMEHRDAVSAILGSLTDDAGANAISPANPSWLGTARPEPGGSRWPRPRTVLAGLAALLIAGSAVWVVARSGGNGHSNPTLPGASQASATPGKPTTIEVAKRFGYGAFAVTLGRATLSGHTLAIDAVFENLASSDSQVDPTNLAVVSAGNSYGWNGDPLPKVAGNARASGTIVFSIFGPFDFGNAELVAGRGDQNQAVVPLGTHGRAHLLEPRAERVSGQATAGTLTVTIVGAVVAAGNFQFNTQASKGKVVVHLGLDARSTERFGENFIADHLALRAPDGEESAAIAGSDEILTAGSTKSGMFADFEVPEPASGPFVLVVRQQANTAEISFRLS